MLNTYVCIKHNGSRSDILCCKCIHSYIPTKLRYSNLRKQLYFLDFAYFFKVCIKEWSQTHTSPLLLNQPPNCSVIHVSDVGIPNMHMYIIECIKYFMYAYETQWIQIKHYQTMLYKHMFTFKIALLNLKTLTFKLHFVPFENCKTVWCQINTALMLYNQSPDCSLVLIEGCRYYKYPCETQLLYMTLFDIKIFLYLIGVTCLLNVYNTGWCQIVAALLLHNQSPNCLKHRRITLFL